MQAQWRPHLLSRKVIMIGVATPTLGIRKVSETARCQHPTARLMLYSPTQIEDVVD